MANYKAIITGHGFAESKNTRTPSIKLSLKATECLDDNTPCDKFFYADLWLSDKAIERTCATLREIGFQGSDMGELNDGQTLVNTEIEITTENEEYNGAWREKVKFVNAAGSFSNRGVKPMDAQQARSIAAKYNSFLKNAPKKTVAQNAPKKGVVQGKDYASPDEDLPWL